MNQEEKNHNSKLLEERNSHIDKVLENHKKVASIVPELQKIRELTELQKKILDDIPEEIEEQLPEVSYPDLKTENQYLKLYYQFQPTLMRIRF